MTNALHNYLKKIIKAFIASILGLLLILAPLGQSVHASKSLMSGDFVKDTVEVAQSLKETISIPDDSENRSESEAEALELITGYISRYRQRKLLQKK